jgi:Double-GTPase 2
MNAGAPICKEPGCNVQVDGKCRLKHDPVESCPNYAAEIDDEVETEAEEEPRTVPPVAIWSSDKMSLADLSALSRRRRLRTIALIGEEKVGKTTLLSSIYGMYCKGPFAGLTFAGSETLLAFAKLHSFALLSSGRSSPSVPRTSRRDPLSFFHLTLARSRGDVVDLAIADRSGETYAAARTSTDLIYTLDELRLADRVCFLLDGGRLASKDDRTAYTRNFRQMINALHDNGALARPKDIEILSTKLDITRGKDAKDIEFMSEYQERIVSDFRAKGLIMSSHEICALPKADRTVGIVGLDDMIRRWTAIAPTPDVMPRPVEAAPRQIDRLLSKI